ncbi:2-polyprenyl-6-methoxyphenol hydroxylase-like FAD-dependent oxidoreductase [Neobacillus niacini]|uniref:FAD-dependent monooxygenase n=1 Tax=Neobacillus niacini TaxID=86668 RepID=UPI0028596E4A|nr:FAD-dependent monooxygenase [Neobacillus niacini]MDR7077395.1 2-polyprenyl-6-methoxyphenol hydroxylase-like FAD-dependent oxidoreductase [Neobacillus niacini]
MDHKVVNVDVCIVGAGPSGALLSYLLAKNGVTTMIIERSSGNTPPFRGEHISAETEDILEEHQLFHKIEEKGLLRMDKVEFFDHGQVIKTITPQKDENHVGIHVPQAHLISTILEEAAKYDQFNHMVKTKGTGLIQSENGSYCGVKAIKGEEEWTINCSIVVGADGRYSTVRNLANIPVEIIKHGYDVLWAKIPAPAGWEPTVRLLLSNGQQLALFTQTGRFVQIGWNIPEGAFPELKKLPLSRILNPLHENFPELKENIERHLKSWKDIVFLDVFSSKSPTWVKDGLVMIGDAAHTMTPTAAIGINTGMKDAYVLAPIITEAIRTKQFSEGTLREFEVLRREKVEYLQEEQINEEKSYYTNFERYSLLETE